VKRLAILLAACALSAPLFAAESVAFVADLSGNASIEGDGKVTFLAELQTGTRLLLGSGSTVAVTYASTGSEFTARGPGEFVVGAAEVKAEKGAAPTKRAVPSLQGIAVVARVSQTATASVRMRSARTDATAAGLQFPVDTRVSTLQPVLLWRGAAGDAQVIIKDANGNEVWKGSGRPGALKPSVKLAPAARYQWTVMTSQGAVGDAQFETLPAEAIAKVSKARAGAKSFSDRVVHALLLQDLGATQEAREAWGALARERPDLPELAGLAR
jgi:hypothetical protein